MRSRCAPAPAGALCGRDNPHSPALRPAPDHNVTKATRMNVLLLGSGGREHALAWKLAQSPRLTKLWAAPGNPGIARHAECVALDHGHLESILAFARSEEIGLVVVGPEQPLVDGLADMLRQNGILTFGPSAAAARLQGPKGLTK